MIEKASNLAIVGGSGSAVFFGLSPGEWQAIGVIGGLLIALAGAVTNYYFKHQHLQLAKAALKPDRNE